jgi:BMFP domain-containing protein YqiC
VGVDHRLREKKCLLKLREEKTRLKQQMEKLEERKQQNGDVVVALHAVLNP